MTSPPLPSLAQSLSARLLLLTVLFVMLGEVLIFVPSVAHFRMTWFEQRLNSANLALLALEATPDAMISQDLADRLLANAGAYAIRPMDPNRAPSTELRRMLTLQMPPKVDARYDLAATGTLEAIGDALAALGRSGSRTLRIVGTPRPEPSMPLVVVLDEAPLRAEMRAYAVRIFEVSLVISLMTATLVFLSLRWLLVRPLRRFIAAMMSFRDNPEDAARILLPSGRTDELGTAERELARLQATVHQALRERARLAALGTAVAKVNHDLRGMLSTARLISDRLADDPSPEVRRSVPGLVAAIDRAVDLCTGTLDFSRGGDLPPRIAEFALGPLVDDVALAVTAGLPGGKAAIAVENRVVSGLQLRADRDQLFRALLNLAQNAAQAGARTLRVEAVAAQGEIRIELADDGPGLNPRARDNLFTPFAGSGRPGGTGLGLAIARELLRAHGGDVMLLATGGDGTRFRLTLPAGEAAPARPLSRARRAVL